MSTLVNIGQPRNDFNNIGRSRDFKNMEDKFLKIREDRLDKLIPISESKFLRQNPNLRRNDYNQFHDVTNSLSGIDSSVIVHTQSQFDSEERGIELSSDMNIGSLERKSENTNYEDFKSNQVSYLNIDRAFNIYGMSQKKQQIAKNKNHYSNQIRS